MLKFIKSRLRSSLSANKLETFIFMATEKDIVMTLDSDMVIDMVTEKSELLRKLLLEVVELVNMDPLVMEKFCMLISPLAATILSQLALDMML
ncbi:unnamed protein product [Merluccius merluccius]